MLQFAHQASALSWRIGRGLKQKNENFITAVCFFYAKMFKNYKMAKNHFSRGDSGSWGVNRVILAILGVLKIALRVPESKSNPPNLINFLMVANIYMYNDSKKNIPP